MGGSAWGRFMDGGPGGPAVALQPWEAGTEDRLRETLEERPLCTPCLGRLFARVGTGLTNRERGEEARRRLGSPEPETCWLCRGLMDEVPKFAELVLRALEGWELETFLVGTRVDPDLLNREEVLWSLLGIDTFEPVKAELNREIGKRVEAGLGKPVEFQRPDVTAVVDTSLDHVVLQVAPLFLCGRYRKLAAIPQTKWPCRRCRGRGCDRCDNTGKMYETSVEEVLAAEVLPQVEGEDHAFHGMGREDVDARMLGDGRPFVLEVRRPRGRTLDLDRVRDGVQATGLVEVLGLRPCTKDDVSRAKSARPDKTYRLVARLKEDRPLGKVNVAVQALMGNEVVQRTPLRVSHRRADRERRRRVVEAQLLRKEGPELELCLRTEAGTYVKELVHGDEGRTRPSLAELLGTEAEVLELDVLQVHDEGRHG